MASSSKALAEFLSEAQEILEALSANLLKLDGDAEPDPDLLNAVFRGAHTLKGMAGMFGVARLAELSHHAEDLLDALRMGRVQIGKGNVDLLLEFVDVATAMSAELLRGDEGAGPGGTGPRATALTARLQQASQPEPPEAPADALTQAGIEASVRAVLTEYEEHRLRENVKKGLTLLRVRCQFDLATFDIGLGEVTTRLKPVGEVISTLPSPEPGEGIAFDLLVGTKRPLSEIAALLEGLPAEVSALAPLDAAPPPVPPPAPRPEKKPEQGGAPKAAQAIVSAPARAAVAPSAPPEELAATGEDLSIRSVSQTVRVDIQKLDRLMNTVGEIVVSKTTLQKFAERMRAEGIGPRDLQGDLLREVRALERRLNELQAGLLEVRMVPLEQVFDKLARLVRKIAREAGKELDFRVQGGDVELDKLIVEELSDPLMHLIRNAVDHGVEKPDARAAKGKAKRGVVALQATQKGNHVVIEIRDDGAGIDPEVIKRVAITRGLITERAASELSRRDLVNLIFMPGFSTAQTVSELSGRGVGMDVVKTNIAHLSGIIDVQTEVGLGTTFAITLPETLAILRALVVQAGGRPYAVPLNSVIQIVEVRPEHISTLEGREVIVHEGQSVPLVRLGTLFGHPLATSPKIIYVVLVGLAQERLGIAVEKLEQQQDIVVKPLGGVLGEIPGIAGATDLGSHQTVLVLDVGALLEEVLAVDRPRHQGQRVA
jgi:two-component system chemotaxis sensor kinase CheA